MPKDTAVFNMLLKWDLGPMHDRNVKGYSLGNERGVIVLASLRMLLFRITQLVFPVTLNKWMWTPLKVAFEPIFQDSSFKNGQPFLTFILFHFRCSHTGRSRVHERCWSNCLQSSVLPADHVDPELVPRSLPPHVPQHQQKAIHVFLDHVRDLEDGMHECSVCLERYLGMTL